MWLYIPKKLKITSSQASHYVQVLEDLNSECTLQNQDIEVFVMSSGRLLQRPLSWRGWQTRPWIALLSGVTLQPLMANNGVTRLISLLQDTRANPSHLLVNAKEPVTQDTSGRILPVLHKKSMQNGYSVKMSKVISHWEWMPSSMTCAQWALQLKRACLARLKLVHPTFGAGSSFWPTPTLSLYSNQADLYLGAKGLRYRSKINKKGTQIALGNVARNWSMMVTVVRLLGGKLQDQKNYPYSHPLHMSLERGSRSSKNEWTFNPNFSDWLMGWPIGWSDPTAQVTEWSHWLQRMRGALSELPLINDAGIIEENI